VGHFFDHIKDIFIVFDYSIEVQGPRGQFFQLKRDNLFKRLSVSKLAPSYKTVNPGCGVGELVLGPYPDCAVAVYCHCGIVSLQYNVIVSLCHSVIVV
jgi:hypothetical protein